MTSHSYAQLRAECVCPKDICVPECKACQVLDPELACFAEEESEE